MRHKEFRGCSFDNTCFDGAYVVGMNLSNHDISGCSFVGADVWSSRFDSCNLTNTTFKDAYISGASFVNAILTNASFQNAWLPDGGMQWVLENKDKAFPDDFDLEESGIVGHPKEWCEQHWKWWNK